MSSNPFRNAEHQADDTFLQLLTCWVGLTGADHYQATTQAHDSDQMNGMGRDMHYRTSL